MCMKNNSDAFSLEPMEVDTNDDIPLDLSLSLSYEDSECSYRQNLNSLNKKINGELTLTLFNKNKQWGTQNF